jgi:hypothetical protein
MLFDPGPTHRPDDDEPEVPRLPALLAQLGTVLCLHPPQDGLGQVAVTLERAARNARLRGRVLIDRHGVSELIDAIDAEGRLLCSLRRLPDSDYYAWEQALARLPVVCGDRVARLRCRDAWIPGVAWTAGVVRTRATAGGRLQLAAEDRCSRTTWRLLQRIEPRLVG